MFTKVTKDKVSSCHMPNSKWNDFQVLPQVYWQNSEVSTKPLLLPGKVSNKTKLQTESQEGTRP